MRFYSHEKGLARSKPLFLSGMIQLFSNISNFRAITIFMMSTCVLSCGPEFSSKRLNNQSNPSPRGTLKESKITEPVFSLSGLKPHRYKAEIKWPEGLSNISVYANDDLAFKATTQKIESCFLVLEDNKEYIIRLVSEKLSEDKSKVEKQTLIAEWKIKTPLDVVINNEILKSDFTSLNKIEIQANRIFIPKTESGEPSLVSGGRDVILIANELIVDRASILTFNEGQKAEVNKDGRSGGTFIIKAIKATGSLLVVLRGEHGGDGINGEAYTDRAAPGGRGKLAEYNCFTDAFYPLVTCVCIPATESRENGEPGFKGAQGRPGASGGKGGSSGSLRIEIKDPSPEFTVETKSEVGIAGTPGKAGPPQPGGIGGMPFDDITKRQMPPVSRCKQSTSGPEGPMGDRGVDGVQQPNGILDQNCKSIGEGFGRCT